MKGGGAGVFLFNRYRVSVVSDELVLETCSTTVCVY